VPSVSNGCTPHRFTSLPPADRCLSSLKTHAASYRSESCGRHLVDVGYLSSPLQMDVELFTWVVHVMHSFKIFRVLLSLWWSIWQLQKLCRSSDAHYCPIKSHPPAALPHPSQVIIIIVVYLFLYDFSKLFSRSSLFIYLRV